MLYIDTKVNTTNDCGFYFGLEEYLIKDYNYDGDIFLLWNTKPSVMIGRHQVTSLEIDAEYVKDNNIEIVRRNSGGGAVYTDPGCLQFSFITNNKSHKNIFEGHVEHIVNSVIELGLSAEFTGRNDILSDGKSLAGTLNTFIKIKW